MINWSVRHEMQLCKKDPHKNIMFVLCLTLKFVDSSKQKRKKSMRTHDIAV